MNTAAASQLPHRLQAAIAPRTRLQRSSTSGFAVIATAHLRLRRLDEGDILAIRTTAADYPTTEGTLGLPNTLAAGLADQRLELGNVTSDRPRAVHWAVCALSDEHLVGYTGLHHVELKSRQAELSFWIRATERRSYAVEAAQAALAFAFLTLQLHQVYALHLACHLAVGNTLHKVGMLPEGVLPQRLGMWAQHEQVMSSAIRGQDWLQSL